MSGGVERQEEGYFAFTPIAARAAVQVRYCTSYGYSRGTAMLSIEQALRIQHNNNNNDNNNNLIVRVWTVRYLDVLCGPVTHARHSPRVLVVAVVYQWCSSSW